MSITDCLDFTSVGVGWRESGCGQELRIDAVLSMQELTSLLLLHGFKLNHNKMTSASKQNIVTKYCSLHECMINLVIDILLI